MKTLFIVRHAKSSWKYPELSDEERPLLEKGKKRTGKVVQYLLDHKVHVDTIISSHAVRALETAKIIAQALQVPEEKLRIDKTVYHSSSDRLMDQFFDLPEQDDSVMIVGHNPTFTSFANKFVSPYIDWLPTSGIVCIDFETDRWEEIPIANKKTRFIVYPKMLT